MLACAQVRRGARAAIKKLLGGRETIVQYKKLLDSMRNYWEVVRRKCANLFTMPASLVPTFCPEPVNTSEHCWTISNAMCHKHFKIVITFFV